MALNANALLSVDEFFQYIKETTPQQTDPKYILVESLINRASDYCEQYIVGPIINKSITEKLDGTGTDEIMVNKLPVQSIASLTVDGVDLTSDVGFYSSGVLFLKNNVFTTGRQNVTVTYTAGHGTNKDTVPQSFKQAALLIVHYWFKRDSLDYSQTFGESEVIFGQWRFPTTALKMLDPFKNYRSAVI